MAVFQMRKPKAVPPPPPQPEPRAFTSQARWNKPAPKKNFIPQQSWLAYNWKDRDPEMDFVQAAIAESGMTLEKIEEQTEIYGHRVSRFTLIAWTYGETKRPQNVTMNTVMAVCGYTRKWERQD